VSVSDTGIGIAPADQTRLFEKFYRVKRRDTLDIKGSGWDWPSSGPSPNGTAGECGWIVNSA